MLFPLIRMEPLVGSSRPLSIFKRVDFPAPEDPMRTRLSPLSTVKEIELRRDSSSFGYVLETFWSSMMVLLDRKFSPLHRGRVL